jgi:hypothetical protein
MADFGAGAPSEPAKLGEYLHERSRIPAQPAAWWRAMATQYWGAAFGLALGLGLAAAGFEVRDSWKEHRDWVVPVIALAGISAGLGIGHLVSRGKWQAAGPVILLALLFVAFVVFDVWRGEVLDGESDAGRKALGVFAAVFLGLAAAAAVISTLVVELRSPSRPPANE